MWYSVNMTCAVVWQEALDEKLAAIEQNKVNLIALVKQTSAKLKFTLNGSVARDLDYLSSALQSAQERLSSLNVAVDDAVCVLRASTSDCPQINVCQLGLPVLSSYTQLWCNYYLLFSCMLFPSLSTAWHAELSRCLQAQCCRLAVFTSLAAYDGTI